MPRKKKPFINKKTATRYVLVNRAKEDLEGHSEEEKVTDKVLVPVNNEKIEEDLPAEVLPNQPKFTEIKSYFFEVDPEIERALEGNSEDEWEEIPDDFVRLASMEPVVPRKGPRRPRGEDDDEERRFTLEEFEEEMRDDEYLEREDITPERQFFHERFEKVLEEYEDEGLDDIEEGPAVPQLDPHYFNEVLDEFIDSESKKRVKVEALMSQEDQHNAMIKNVVERYQYEDSSEGEMEEVVVEEEEKWDCESILSTYSNLDNHPKLIVEPNSNANAIKLSNKTGIPLGVLPAKETNKVPSPSKPSQDNKGEARKKDETPEERKARKQSIKEEKKMNRERKKALKQVYKSEEMSLKSSIMTSQKTVSIP